MVWLYLSIYFKWLLLYPGGAAQQSAPWEQVSHCVASAPLALLTCLVGMCCNVLEVLPKPQQVSGACGAQVSDGVSGQACMNSFAGSAWRFLWAVMLCAQQNKVWKKSQCFMQASAYPDLFLWYMIFAIMPRKSHQNGKGRWSANQSQHPSCSVWKCTRNYSSCGN